MFGKILIVIVLFITNVKLLAQNVAEESFNYKRCFLQHIRIVGETNLNQFTLFFHNTNSNYISVKEKRTHGYYDEKLIEFRIPVEAFEGNNHLLVNDFRNLVDASNHPSIIVEIEKKVFDYIYLSSFSSALTFYLTIAGKKEYVQGEYKTNIRNNSVVLKGSAKIRLSDFSITPPQKMFGMLQVKDVIIIKFDILIRGSNT